MREREKRERRSTGDIRVGSGSSFGSSIPSRPWWVGGHTPTYGQGALGFVNQALKVVSSWQAGLGQSTRDKTLVRDNTLGCWESGRLLSGRHFEDFFQRSRPTLNKTVIVVVLEFKGCCVSLFFLIPSN
ncbi:hypothetical protein Gorai_023894 [Gossypium raimondii]|uniref:Uncharacterized protein n=1 Tax=Gossypium raimondii TaxID=29730 RepID=A0A7J8NXI6_GOSRA|nr:hypothetical protein [Gossypium raimondii]